MEKNSTGTVCVCGTQLFRENYQRTRVGQCPSYIYRHRITGFQVGILSGGDFESEKTPPLDKEKKWNERIARLSFTRIGKYMYIYKIFRGVCVCAQERSFLLSLH